MPESGKPESPRAAPLPPLAARRAMRRYLRIRGGFGPTYNESSNLSGATNVTDRGFCESIGYRYVEVRERVLYFIAETYPGEPR